MEQRHILHSNDEREARQLILYKDEGQVDYQPNEALEVTDSDPMQGLDIECITIHSVISSFIETRNSTD